MVFFMFELVLALTKLTTYGIAAGAIGVIVGPALIIVCCYSNFGGEEQAIAHESLSDPCLPSEFREACEVIDEIHESVGVAGYREDTLAYGNNNSGWGVWDEGGAYGGDVSDCACTMQQDELAWDPSIFG